MRPALAVVLAAALTACGLTADVDVERVCVRIPQQQMPGVTPGFVSGISDTLPPVRVPFSVGAGLPDLQNRGVTDVQVPFLSLDLTSSQEAPFIRTLTIRVVPAAGSTTPPPKTLVSYQRPDGTAPTTIHVDGDRTNLIDYLEAQQLTLEISGEGDPSKLPSTIWTADAKLCVGAKATVDYIQAASN